MKKKKIYQSTGTEQAETIENSKKSIPSIKNRKSKVRAIGSMGNRFLQHWFPDTKRGKQ